MKAVYFSKVKKWRKVCLHRFRQDGCMDAGEPVTIQLGGGQSKPFPWEPELISDSIKYFQCEPIEGDWRSYYISQVRQTHCVYEALSSCIRVAVEALPFHCVSSW